MKTKQPSNKIKGDGQIINETLFLKVIKDRFEMMIKKQIENPNLIIPKNFETFILGKLFMEFLMSVYQYCTELNKAEKKQKILEAEAKDRIMAPPQFLETESNIVNQKLKTVSETYCLIILQQGSYQVMYRDQNFFETMIYFLTQVLKEVFDREEYKSIEEEINRIFRTNTFNLIKKRHFEDERLKKFPVLKDSTGKETIDTIINKMSKRSRIPKTNWKYQMIAEKSDIKPYFIKQTACSSINSRSPLIAMLLPSAKERLFQQEKQRKTREASSAFRTQLQKNDLSYLQLEQKQTEKNNRSYLSYHSRDQSINDISKIASNSFIL